MTRTIEVVTKFKRDFKKVKATPRYRKEIDNLLQKVLNSLVEDKVLPESNLDHSLSGEWQGYRECHLKPDLLLIYRKPNRFTLQLVRMGSHSELFD